MNSLYSVNSFSVLYLFYWSTYVLCYHSISTMSPSQSLYCVAITCYGLYILIVTYVLITLFRINISVCVYDNNDSIIIQNEALASTTTILGTNSISEV